MSTYILVIDRTKTGVQNYGHKALRPSHIVSDEVGDSLGLETAVRFQGSFI